MVNMRAASKLCDSYNKNRLSQIKYYTTHALSFLQLLFTIMEMVIKTQEIGALVMSVSHSEILLNST